MRLMLSDRYRQLCVLFWWPLCDDFRAEYGWIFWGCWQPGVLLSYELERRKTVALPGGDAAVWNEAFTESRWPKGTDVCGSHFLWQKIFVFSFRKKYNLPNPKGRDSRSLRLPEIYGAMSGRSLWNCKRRYPDLLPGTSPGVGGTF